MGHDATPRDGRTVYPPFVGKARSLTDAGQLAGIFQTWRGRIDQLTSGRFMADLRVVVGETVRAMTIHANQRVHARGGESERLVSLYAVTPDNAGSHWQGHHLRPGQFIVLGPDGETDHCSARDSTIRGVSVRPDRLLDALRVFLKRDDVSLPGGWDTHTPPPRIAAMFLRAQGRMIARGTSPRHPADPRDLGPLEQDCLRLVVETLSTHVLNPGRLSLSARTRLLRRAEEFMLSRIGDPFGALDLCRELGISDRTLRLAFRERFGLGPMAYFKSLRLNAVRSLLRGTPDLRVSVAARACGFRHLGNFAADYSRLFKERPVDTVDTA